MIKLILVGLGGFVGAISRYWIGTYFESHSEAFSFPLGILIVNLLGCFIIGIMAGITEFTSIFNEELKLLLFVGLLGSFTTFSTFSHDTLNLISQGLIINALINILISVIVGILSVGLGYKLIQLFLN